MSLKSLFVPEVQRIYQSEINGEIKLTRFADDLRLEAGGLIQSGNVMVWIWSTGIKNLLPKAFRPEKILFLGLGGGTAVKWLAKRYLEAKVIAVDIDPVMIEIAKRHFRVDREKNLFVINADAVKFIRETPETYDLILVDCYQGHDTPPGFDDPKIIAEMRSKTKYLLVNRLYWDDFKRKADDFVEKMSRHFRIKSVFTASNLVISLAEK